VGGMIESASRDPFFEFDILRVDVARWLDIGQRGTRAVRQSWIAPDPAASDGLGSRYTSPTAGSYSRFRIVASGAPPRQPACGAPHEGR
jgi:hypothetical protein